VLDDAMIGASATTQVWWLSECNTPTGKTNTCQKKLLSCYSWILTEYFKCMVPNADTVNSIATFSQSVAQNGLLGSNKPSTITSKQQKVCKQKQMLAPSVNMICGCPSSCRISQAWTVN